jgi:hypothetical protein
VEAIKRYTSVLSDRQWSILLTGFAILLWAYSLVQTKLNLDGYGLIHSYPATFFISLGILTIASAILWFSKEKCGNLLLLQLSFLIISLWLTPLLIGGIGNSQPSLATSFTEYGNTDFIVRHAHFSPDISWRLNWPGVYILSAEIVELFKLTKPDFMIAILPFIWQLIIFLPFYLIFNNTIGDSQRNYRWAAIWVLYAGGWSEVAILHTQTLSNLLILTLLVILTMRLLQKYFGPGSSSIASVVITACLTITHLMSSVIALVIVFVMSIPKKLVNYGLAFFSIILIAGWLIYGTANFFAGQLPAFVDKIMRLDILLSSSITAREVGNAAHQAVVEVRLLFTILFGIIGIAGFLLGRKRKLNADSIMVAMGIAIISVAVVIGAGYGWETPQRFFFFILVPITYFGVKLLQNRITAIILVILLIVSLPFYFVSRYGNQAVDYSSPATIISWHYFEDHTSSSLVVSNGIYGGTTNIDQYSITYLTNLVGNADPLAKLPAGYPFYFCLSRQDQILFENNYGLPDFIPDIESTLNATKGDNIIYINPDIRIDYDGAFSPG